MQQRRRAWGRAALAWAMVVCATCASGATIKGEVVSVADGDTVTVLDASRMQHRIRLVGIDAPERKQAFGTRSRGHLAALVFRKTVTVDFEKRDRYGRVVGKVIVGGTDASLEQVRAGMAWHYKAYASEQASSDRVAYAWTEEDARAARRGLWRDPAPVPPWEYRRPPEP